MKKQIEELLRGIRPDIDFANEEHLISNGLLESIDIVEIVVQVEDQLGITIPSAELKEENFESMESITALVERLAT